MPTRLPLLAALALPAGCFDRDLDADTGEKPSPPDSADTDVVDTDDHVDPEETGVGLLYWLGEFTTADGELVSAELGFGVYGPRLADYACTLRGTLAYEGPAPDGCPDCEWAFDLGPLEAIALDGPYCDAIAGDNLFTAPGALEGYFDWSWGFAPTSTYYYGDTATYTLAETLFVNVDGTSWDLFAFNYGTYLAMLEGDATALTLVMGARSESGYYSYYYYYR